MNSITIGNTTIIINNSYIESVTLEQKLRDRMNLEDAARNIVEEMHEREQSA